MSRQDRVSRRSRRQAQTKEQASDLQGTGVLGAQPHGTVHSKRGVQVGLHAKVKLTEPAALSDVIATITKNNLFEDDVELQPGVINLRILVDIK